MNRKLRDIAAACLGFVLVALGFVRRAKKEVIESGVATGIYFHNPGKRLFEKSIKWLIKNGFTIITADELTKILQGSLVAKPGSVWISLDDGWKENMVNVLPFAARNKIPVTFFISTEPVEMSGVFWWSIAEKYRTYLPEPFKGCFVELWKVPEAIRAGVMKNLIDQINSGEIKGRYGREAMTIEDVKEIAGYDFFTIGGHTVNHAILPNCADEELRYELSESKQKLEGWTGKEVNTFSYPNGDYDGREKEYLGKSGYIMATIQGEESITPETDRYKVPRFSVGDGYFSEELCHMFGVWQRIMKKLKSK